MLKKFKIFFLFLLLSYVLSLEATAQDMAVPVNTQLDIFMKIFQFDRNIRRNNNKQLNILVLYQSKFRLSLTTKNNIMDESDNQKYLNLSGLAVKFIPYELKGANDLSDIVSSAKISIIYLTPMRNIDLNEILNITKNKKVLTITGVPSWISEGISAGIDLKGDKPVILINLQSSKAEGSDFSSQLLKLSTVIN